MVFDFRHLWTAVALFVFALVPASASAADPVPFASASGTCPAGRSVGYRLSPASTAHQAVVSRITTAGGSASWVPNEFGTSQYLLSGPDVMWQDGFSSVAAGDADEGVVYCYDQDTPFTVEEFDLPSVPTSFSGATTAGGAPNYLAFDVPSHGQYVANLSLAQGSVAISADASTSKEFASSGPMDLGTLTKGVNRLRLDALDGPQARWTVRVAPVPVTLSGLRVSPKLIVRGQVSLIRYTLSGDGQVTATVERRGRVVKTLATSLAVSRGKHSLRWDGREGKRRSGDVYTVRISARNLADPAKPRSVKLAVAGSCPAFGSKRAPGVYYSRIGVLGTSCGAGKRAIRAWSRNLRTGTRQQRRCAPGQGTTTARCRVGSYRCKAVSLKYAPADDLTCAKGRSRVLWRAEFNN